MKRRSIRPPRFRAWAVACALLVALGLCAESALAGEGWWGGLDEGEAVSLADVMRGPRDYRNRIITFYAVFHTADGAYKYYPPNTAFSEQRHVNFSAWPDGAPVWDERTFKQGELVFLYLRRTNTQRVELLRLPLFTRIEVTGKIRDLVRGKPAIEVFSFRTTGHRLGKRVVRDIMDGNAYARAGTTQGYQLAARSYKEALQPDLPPAYAMQVRKLLADALRKLGHHEEARRYENGESVGMPTLPKPEPGKTLPQPPPMPDDMPQPFNPATSGARPPAARDPVGSPDGDAPTGALPPAPLGPPPGGVGSPDAGSPDGGSRNAGPPAGALPPAPLGPGEQLPEGMPPPAPSYGGEGTQPARSAPQRTPKKAKDRSAPPRRSGIPPKRRPRLNGVK